MTITPQDCRAARLRLGLSASRMARALGLTDGRAVRRFEADDECSTAREPRGPLAVLYGLILAGVVQAKHLDIGPARGRKD